MMRRLFLLGSIPFVLASCAAAQDTRRLTEPVIPRMCTTLDAQLVSVGHTLAPADETRLDTAYNAAGTLKGSSPPTMRDVVLHNVRVSGGGKFTFNGYDHTHRIGVQLNGVLIADDAHYTCEVNQADVTLGPDPTNLDLSQGDDSTITGKPSQGTPASCAAMFVPFPE